MATPRKRKQCICHNCGRKHKRAGMKYCGSCEQWVRAKMIRDGYLCYIPEKRSRNGEKESGL